MKDKLPKQIAPIASVLSSVLAIVCPLCVPALGALLASVGLGFALKLQVVKGALILFLAIALLSLAWSCRFHKNWKIFILGLFGAILIYAGRHIWFSILLMWIGAIVLIGASVWNSVAKSRCHQCKE